MNKTLTAAAIAVSAVLALTACSGSSEPAQTPEGSGEGGALTPVNVAVVPVADVAPLYLGIKEGYFEDEGLDVTLQNVGGAAAAVPLLLNGELQFAYGALIPVVTAAASGVPAVFVTGGVERPASAEEDYSALATVADSDVDSVSDLAGKKVGVNALRAGPQLVTIATLEAAGLSESDVEWVEIPMSEGIQAVERGNVDVVYLAEPFRTQAEEAGLKLIGSPTYSGAIPGATSGYFGVQDYVAGNAETVDAFTRALDKSVVYANENEAAVRAEIAEYSGMDAAAVEAINLPTFTSEIGDENVQAVIDQLSSVGWIDQEPDVATLVR